MSRSLQAKHLSELARKLLEELLHSGQSEQVYIAESLDAIASNDEHSASDEFLTGCARELEDAARWFREQLYRQRITEKPQRFCGGLYYRESDGSLHSLAPFNVMAHSQVEAEQMVLSEEWDDRMSDCSPHFIFDEECEDEEVADVAES